ncbi:MAG TPA: S9 family peptidase, partial [Thermoanaerobaculia bacterium]
MKRAAGAALMVVAAFGASVPGFAESVYKLPPKEVVEAVDAAAFPEAIASPSRDALLLVDIEAYPPISLLARPMLRIAGIRIDPAMSSRRRVRRATGISIQRYDGSPAMRVALPAGARIGSPLWSRDGKRFAFARDLDSGVELWVGDAATGAARAVPGTRLNDVLTRPFTWTREGRLLAWTIPSARGAAPADAPVPGGPIVEETAGKRS